MTGRTIDPEETYTFAEAARLKGVHWNTIYKAMRQGRLATVGEPGRWRVVGSALMVWTPGVRQGAADRSVPYGYLTIAQAAAAKAVHGTAVHKAILTARLPAKQDDGRWLIAHDDLFAWAPDLAHASPRRRDRLPEERQIVALLPRLGREALREVLALVERLGGKERKSDGDREGDAPP